MKAIKTICLAALLIVATATSSLSDENSPTGQLQPTILELFAILDDPSFQGDANRAVRRSKIMEAISGRFDFREMSKRILGRTTWDSLSAEDKDYFVAQVTKLLENVYIGKLEGFEGREVEFAAERIKGKRAQVTTQVVYEGSEFPIHYIMQREHDHWMVYDINIEGVSLVRNYMEQFRAILRQQKYEGLIKIIEDKNREFAKNDGKG